MLFLKETKRNYFILVLLVFECVQMFKCTEELTAADLTQHFTSYLEYNSSDMEKASVCSRPDGCWPIMFQNYQRVLVTNYGYNKRICRCTNGLNYQCGSKYCTQTKEACINFLKIVSQTRNYSFFNLIKKC